MCTHITRTGHKDKWSPAYSICMHRRDICVCIAYSSLVPRPRPAFRRLQYRKAGGRGREKGREDLIERRRIIEVPTHVSTVHIASCVLVGAHLQTISAERSSAKSRKGLAALEFNSALRAILWGEQRSVCQVSE